MRRQQRTKISHQAGFTLVEVMVTMVIIGLMTAGVVINVLPMLSKARIEKAEIDIKRLAQATEYYHLEKNAYPQALTDLLASGNANSGARQGAITILPEDPWGNAYLYAAPGQYGAYDIWSYGADGEEGGEDENADITSWTK